jgi:hypothetical protein
MELHGDRGINSDRATIAALRCRVTDGAACRHVHARTSPYFVGPFDHMRLPAGGWALETVRSTGRSIAPIHACDASLFALMHAKASVNYFALRSLRAHATGHCTPS